MKSPQDTRSALISTARQLFAEYGYDGTSVRAITARAEVNLGAITYHFGSKRSLYEAVIDSVTRPLRQRIASAADEPGSPLDRIELILRKLFDFFSESPELPRLMTQQLMSPRPIARATLRTVEANIRAVASVIAGGQKDGSIRPGDPLLMALSVGAPPLWLAIARRALAEGAGIDQSDPDTLRETVDSVVHFVREGLASHVEKTE